jgi:cyclopropane-fatty-acyl-phospholipid synthase
MYMALAQVFEAIAGPGASVEFQAYDGSSAGSPGSPVKLTVRSPVAVSYLAQAPGALGLARAYVSGHLDVDGNMFEALSRLSKAQDTDISWGDRIKLLRDLGGPKVLFPRVAPPPQEVIPDRRRFTIGAMHSKKRDANSISHHYDVSNTFYEWVLGPSMTYTCACYPHPDATLEEAQENKYRLVFDKLRLKPGDRLLDVGCGWGGMVRYAARHGVRALGVTLSKAQAEWAQKAIAEQGLSDLAEVRHGDYRDVRESGFDAVSSIGLTEHIGVHNYPSYFRFLKSKMRNGALLLNHCITRPDNRSGPSAGGFIDRYVFPDGELTGSGRIITEAQDVGLEVVHEENLRHHYALTLRDWCRNLVAHWDEAVAEVGLPTAKVWGLYMAGSRLGFETNVVQLHQVLAVKLDSHGNDGGLPLRPWWTP